MVSLSRGRVAMDAPNCMSSAPPALGSLEPRVLPSDVGGHIAVDTLRADTGELYRLIVRCYETFSGPPAARSQESHIQSREVGISLKRGVYCCTEGHHRRRVSWRGRAGGSPAASTPGFVAMVRQAAQPDARANPGNGSRREWRLPESRNRPAAIAVMWRESPWVFAI